jgi:Tfp pilus assembly protein PilE
MKRPAAIRDERGTTLIELLVATTAGVVILFAISAMVIVSLRETVRINSHVDATQRARVVLTKVIEELHSACVAPQIAPVREGSTGTQLIFIHQTGSAVAPTPVLSKVTLSGGILSQSEYLSTGGEAPEWSFAETPSSTQQLMTNLSPTSPSTSIFSYYSYSNGEVSATPLPTPLESANAKRTVKVGIALTAAPQSTPIADPNAAANITDSALLRFTPAAFDTTTNNLPCE